MTPKTIRLFLLCLAFPAAVFAQYDAMSFQELMQKAEAGDVEAQFRLGSRYDTGDRVSRDGAQATKWYRRAAEAGHANAQNSMGSIMQAEKRYEEARSWYERAAAQGQPLAINSLGYLYDLGLGVAQDRQKGFELYSRAADLGWAEAMWNLANIYGAGQLGTKDLGMACVWTFRAVKYVDPNGRQRLAPAARAAGFFERSFPKDQLAACKQKAEEWQPANASAGQGTQQGAAFAAHAPGQPVTPKQRFPNDLLNVYSPDSEGWVVTGAGMNGIELGKRGRESGETYGAQVVFFEMSPTGNSDEFTSFVKKRIATMNPAPRFHETGSDFQYGEARGYPCVDVRVTYDDHAAMTPTGREQLKLKVVSLYCRHPVRQDLGFFAAYSYRGKAADTQIESAAKSFIEAITVPK